MVYLHTMKFIQPHLLRLDLPVEWGKLLCHSVTKTNSSRLPLCLLVCMLFTQEFFYFLFLNRQLSTLYQQNRWQMDMLTGTQLAAPFGRKSPTGTREAASSSFCFLE